MLKYRLNHNVMFSDMSAMEYTLKGPLQVSFRYFVNRFYRKWNDDTINLTEFGG